MNIAISKKYLIFPVNTDYATKKLSFFSEDKEVFSIHIRLDNFSPNFYAYIDVSRFMGQTLSISVAPEIEISYSQSDKMNIDNLYSENMRPQIHFTTKNGWINDPNGLIYIDGTYHMFYQHNPGGPVWDNMHWGHAESRDLIHWEEKDIALFPDETGMMFSGSAVIDKNNVLGLQNGNTPTSLLFYTATNPFSQHMAYSTDNFKTIHKYQQNPVLPNIIDQNRDPKVVFCDELGCYIMALYLEKDTYALFKSDNLTDWKLLQHITLPGDGECPDIFCLKDQYGDRKWVLMGAKDKYIVGRFTDAKFEPLQPVQSFHYESSGYAGQSFYNLPGGRIVRMVWDMWADLRTPPFAGQMSIPVELTLEKHNDRYYISGNPVKELTSIYDSSRLYSDICLKANKCRTFSLEDKPAVIKIKGGFDKKSKLDFSIFGISFMCDMKENIFKINEKTAPVSCSEERFDLTIIIDRCSTEVFIDGGKVFLTDVSICDRNINYFEINSDTDYNIEAMEIHSLKSIWSR